MVPFGLEESGVIVGVFEYFGELSSKQIVEPLTGFISATGLYRYMGG